MKTIGRTKEEEILEYVKNNSPVLWQDIVDQFGVTESYAKSLLSRIKNNLN